MIGDILTLEMRGEAAQLQKTLDETNKRAKDLKKTISEIEKDGGKGSENWQKYKNELKACQEQSAKLAKELKTLDVSKMTIRQLEVHAKDLAKELKNADRSSQDFAKNSKRLGEVEKELEKAKKQATELKKSGEDLGKNTLWSKITTGVKSVGTAFSAFMALQVVQFLYNMVKGIFDTTAQFEKYAKVLETALGSQEQAKSSMAAIKKLAAETSFSVDELTDGYVKMVNRGLRPSKDEMVKLTDLAASQGKTFDQLVEAVLDAQTGEFERLKEFGIKARKEGDNVSLSFKGQTQTVKNNEEAIYQAMVAMGAMTGVAGQNAKMMETLGGQSSNLEDNFMALQGEIGEKLQPVFVAVLKVLNYGIDIIRILVSAIATAISAVKNYYTILWQFAVGAGGVLSNFGTAIKEFLSGNFDAAAKAWDNTKNAANSVMTGVKDGVKKAAGEIKAIWSNPDAAKDAEFAGKLQGENFNNQLTDAQKKAAEKREKEKAKELEKQRKVEQKHLEDVKKDNEKALNLIAQLEAEHGQAVADTTLEIEESKIREKQRKRLAEIETSKADENNKTKAIAAINRTAEAELEKAREEFRLKRLKADEEAAKKRLEAENFIRSQELQAEKAIYDFRELQARGNATKIAAIKKERVDTELRLTQDKLQGELLAEQAKAAREISDAQLLAETLKSIETRYHAESVLAESNAAAEKKKIDEELHKAKADKLKGYSDMFGSLLKGDVTNFLNAASSMVKGHLDSWQQKLNADMQNYQAGAEMAQQAVSFLNDLAQKKADKAIAEAFRERDEKVASLNQEIAITESMITSSSNYVTALKEAETNRLTELQQILTSETATEEQKRDAMKRYYSEQLQQMKEAEENKIMELQKLANLAKTEDEKRAIEEKIAMAQRESEEKIRLAEEEMKAKTDTINELKEFNTEVTEFAMAEATQYSEKSVNMAQEEAEKKATFKEELEEMIAAENRKAAATERAEKLKAWRAQKKADIATALITGALAVLKALANVFPLNIVFAAVAAALTAVQVVKIKNQPEPTFADGGVPGFVAQGGKHGSSYGTGGISLTDRASGREVGEMEGGEAIVSADQTEANWPLIQAMFKNARTPGMRKKPIIPLDSFRSVPMAFRDGGVFESPYWERGMYLFGSKKKKAKAAAAAAEAEAAAAQADADAMGMDPSVDTSGFSGDAGSAEGVSTAEAQEAHKKAEERGEKQIKLQELTVENTEKTVLGLLMLATKLKEVKGAVDDVQSAVRSVEGAVNNSNNSGKFDQLIGSISRFSLVK